jgi:hypothetical protein
MSDDKLYRVILKTTAAWQPAADSYWHEEVIYCGYDRADARKEYHRNKCQETNQGAGNKRVLLVLDVIRDAETDDFDDDEVVEAEEV